jgi:5'-3' exonuclease/transcription antitermination factor NusG
MAETDQWVVLELGPKAEGEDPDHIRASIRHSIRDAEVFIPASVTKNGEDKVIQYLMEGYAFVKRTHPDHTYLRLENTKYVQAVLRQPSVGGGRNVKQIASISDREIDRFRSQIRVEVDQGISVGDLVCITSGAYRQINAIVEEEIPELDQVQVHVQLRSKQAIVTLPRACLRLVRKATKSVHRERLDAVQAWLRSAWTILGWPRDEATRVLLPYETYMQLGDWLLAGQQRVKFITSFNVPLNFTPVQERYKVYETLSRWNRGFGLYRAVRAMDRPIVIPPIGPLLALAQEWERVTQWLREGKKLYGMVNAVYNPPPSPKLDSRYLDWVWMNDINERLDAVCSSLGDIEQALQSGGKAGMFQNLIVDGTQLALRCLLVPGLDSLKDSKGRPTGAIMGFCQSLASLKKRFPSTTFYVTWDCSSQRRKKQFPGYKASRASRSPMATFEIQFLKSLLPKLGVYQAFNPEEEADDVMATLVRDRLKGQLNAILTTDRDMLQLVTETDHQLVPAVGTGKEKLYTVESVINEYGVGPDRITQVRALMGDTSDEIPGADGFGLKTSSKLVKVYGTLEQLFTSNFAGLTPKQFTSLRAAEKQVRLNLELMKLHDDLVLTIVGPDPDQIAATERLREVDIKPDPLLAFFNNAPGLSAHV